MSEIEEYKKSSTLSIVTTKDKLAPIKDSVINTAISPIEYSPASVVFTTDSILADSKNKTIWKMTKRLPVVTDG